MFASKIRRSWTKATVAAVAPASRGHGPEAAPRETTRGRGFDFSRISIDPSEHGSAWSAPATREATRSGGAAGGEEEVTANGTPSPAPAPGVTPPGLPAPPTTFAPSGQCHVESGPIYVPSGTIPVTKVGGRKSASFSMGATFGTAFVTVPPRRPSCCEVRQYIKWNEAYHTWKGGPPHSGFPSSATYDTWYEDRDTADKRYGHRAGPHSDPIADCGDEYRTRGTRDQANGDVYCGKDNPQSSAPAGATYNFQLKVIDTCNGNAVKASSSVITINW